MAELSLFVAIPSGRDAKWPFPVRLANLMVHLVQTLPQGSRVDLQVGRMYDTAQTRRKLVASAKEWKATHLLFIDDDMDFPHDSATRLLAHGKSIVAANYTCRGWPVIGLAKSLDGHRIASRGKRGLEEVDFAPSGLMLIAMDTFTCLSKPYFDAPPVTPNSDEGISDDVYFCRKARAAGIATWIDHDLSQQVGHIGDSTFTHSMMAEPNGDLLSRCREILS